MYLVYISKNTRSADLCRHGSISFLNSVEYVQQSFNYSVNGKGNISYISILKKKSIDITLSFFFLCGEHQFEDS